MTDIMGEGAPLGQGPLAPTATPEAFLPPPDDAAPPPSAHERRVAERFCRAILPSASRTFAISIRALPGTLGRAVLTSYLICRIADTIEDEGTLAPTGKVRQLDALLACFDGPAQVARFVQDLPPLTGNADHALLVRESTQVFVLYRSLPPRTRAHIRRWVLEMVTGMQRFVTRHPQGIRVQTDQEFREYCYYVAGTVGYLLTDLWHEHSPAVDGARHALLEKHCQAFGQALQTVNIVKDVARDAADENSIYIPEESLRRHGSSHATILSPEHVERNHAAVMELVEQAWRDLDEARTYLLDIPRRAAAIRLFCVLPLLFAYATLRELSSTTAMLRPGGSPRIARREVKRLMTGGTLLVMSNRGLRWLTERASGGRTRGH